MEQDIRRQQTRCCMEYASDYRWRLHFSCRDGSFGFGKVGVQDLLLIKVASEFGTQIDSTANSIILYRGATDTYGTLCEYASGKQPKTNHQPFSFFIKNKIRK